MNIIGIDSSISSPCACVYNVESFTNKIFCYTSNFKAKKIELLEHTIDDFKVKVIRQPTKKRYESIVKSDVERRIHIATKIFENIKEFVEDDTIVVF